jgi:hypothetical protein
MMLADLCDGAGLQPLLTFAGMGEKADFVANAQPVEGIVDDAVAVHVDLLSIGRQDEAVTLVREQTSDRAVLLRFMGLGLPTDAPGVVLKPPAHSIESIADGDIDVFMGVMFRRIASDGNFMSGHLQIDAEVIDPPFSMVVMSAFDDDAAAHNPLMEAFELINAVSDLGFDRVRGLHAAKSDLWGQLHRVLRLLLWCASAVTP